MKYIFFACSILGKCDYFGGNLNLAKVRSGLNQYHFLCKLSHLGTVMLASCLQ